MTTNDPSDILGHEEGGTDELGPEEGGTDVLGARPAAPTYSEPRAAAPTYWEPRRAAPMNSNRVALTGRPDWADSATVYACGLVQGIALVTFPAASTIFTAPTGYDLTSSQYGFLFAPQMSMAIVAALLGAGLLWPGLTRHASEKTICLVGLAADLASMVLLTASWLSCISTGPRSRCCWRPRRASARASASRCRR